MFYETIFCNFDVEAYHLTLTLEINGLVYDKNVDQERVKLSSLWIKNRFKKIGLTPHVQWRLYRNFTAQKMMFFMTDLFSKCDQIRRKLRLWSHLLKKSLMENFIFSAVQSDCSWNMQDYLQASSLCWTLDGMVAMLEFGQETNYHCTQFCGT